MFELITPRLILRDFVSDDWATIYALSQEPVVARLHSWLRLKSPDEAQYWVEQAIFHNNLRPRYAYNLALYEQSQTQSIGWLGWGQADDRTQPVYSFGYALLPAFWNRGYMTEALQAAISFIFDTLQAELVHGRCESINPASARVMEHVGMKLVKEWQEVNEQSHEIEYHRRYEIRATDRHVSL